MAPASYARCSFLGGEWSKTAQGRFDEPAYATSLNVCLNSFPTEQGALTRRSGTQNLQPTRGGAKGRVYKFDINETSPYVFEFTDGFLRFRAFGPANSGNATSVALVTTNDAQAVAAISAATPAVVQTASAHGWSSGNTALFFGLGTNNALLQNRQFTITVVDATHFSIADALTGAGIDGATLGAFVSGTVARIAELATPYTSGSWSGIISVQTETQAVLLNGSVPQIVTMLTPPAPNANATFSIAAANFLDGPYLDPFTGSICTYNATSGNVTLTFSFDAWSSTTSYSKGDYVLYSGQSYQSTQSANLNNAPSGSSSYWTAVNGGAPVGPSGFTASDIGRHVRLFSEPPAWSSTGTYAALAVVGYNGGYWQALNSTAAALIALGSITGGSGGTNGTYTDIPLTGGHGANATANITVSGGAVTAVAIVDPGDGYVVDDTLSATASNIGNVSGFSVPVNKIGNIGIVPGTDADNWVPVTGAAYAQWTWGRIISISGAGLIDVATPLGSMTNVGDAFNGTPSQDSGNCATASDTVTAATQWSGLTTPYSSGTLVYNGGNFYQCTNTFSICTSLAIPTAGYYYNATGSTLVDSDQHNVPAGDYFYATAGTIGGGIGGSIITNLGGGGLGNGSFWSFQGAAPTASLDVYAGGNFSSSAKAVQSVTIFPSTDQGYGCNDIMFNLWASNSAPSSPASGTLLGTISGVSQFQGAVSITSNNQSATWNYIWVEAVVSSPPYNAPNGANTFTLDLYVAQIELYTPNVVNGSVVTIQLVGPALLYPAGTVINTWRAGVYTASVQPTCGCYHEGRLWLGGAIGNRWDSSQVNDIFNMAPTEPDGTVDDSCGISAIADSDGVNTTFWMETDALGVIVGTEAGEWLIQATTSGTAITPSNIQAHRVTKAQCAPIEAVRTEHTLVAVQKQKRKVFEYFADIFSGKFTAPNLTEWARHLTTNFIEEIRYQQELTPTIWARDGAGALLGCTYRRDTLMTSQGPTFKGWHRHALGSGRLVESITVGPSQGGTLDALIMVTNDLTSNIRHVELLTDFFEETDNIQDAWLVDNGIAPSSYSVGLSGVTFNGLWYLNGKTVTVFAAGLDCGDFAVSNGSVTVPFGDGISEGAGGGLFTAALVNSFPSGQMPAVIGFTYTSQGQLTRPMTPQESGARTGPALGKKRRFDQYGASIVIGYGGGMPEAASTPAGLQFGTNFGNLFPAQFRQSDDKTPLAYGTAFAGIHWDSLDDTSSFDGMLCWQISRPWPALIAAVEPFGATQDR